VVNPEEWGMTWNVPIDGSGLVVGKESFVTLEGKAAKTNG
jgi:hypothetical protein